MSLDKLAGDAVGLHHSDLGTGDVRGSRDADQRLFDTMTSNWDPEATQQLALAWINAGEN